MNALLKFTIMAKAIKSFLHLFITLFTRVQPKTQKKQTGKQTDKLYIKYTYCTIKYTILCTNTHAQTHILQKYYLLSKKYTHEYIFKKKVYKFKFSLMFKRSFLYERKFCYIVFWQFLYLLAQRLQCLKDTAYLKIRFCV